MPTRWTGRRSATPLINSANLLNAPLNAVVSATLYPSHLQRMLSSAHVDCELEDNNPVRLRNAAGLQLKCMEGIAWITFHGDPNDLMLHAGHVAVVPNGGLVLMEGVGRARVRLALNCGLCRSHAGSMLETAMPRWLAWLSPRCA